jgi:predicted aspartyl protease
MKIPMYALMLMAFAFPALARDSTWDLRCLVTDKVGNKLTYSFGMQLEDKKFPEVGFTNNGENTTFPEDNQPEWTKVDGENHLQFKSDATPNLALVLTELRTQGDMLYANVSLLKNNESVGAGTCNERLYTPATVPATSPKPQSPTQPGSIELRHDVHGGMAATFSVGQFSYSALVDTGNAFDLSLNREAAEELVRNGLARWAGRNATAILANGSRTFPPILMVSTVTIAGRTVDNVRAISGGTPMLIGLPLLNRISGGKFSFSHGKLTFD